MLSVRFEIKTLNQRGKNTTSNGHHQERSGYLCFFAKPFDAQRKNGRVYNT